MRQGDHGRIGRRAFGAEHFGAERQASVSREISKMHEETVRGTLTELIEHFTANEPRGEIVIVVAGIDD